MICKTYDLIVPFGCNCMSALQLRVRGLRRCAFPLDWVAVGDEDCNLLGRLFQNKFEGFLDLGRLEIVESDSGDGHLVIQDKDYHYCFVHDFLKGKIGGEVDGAEYEEVSRKYLRRINRLYTVVDLSERILFVCNFKNGSIVADDALVTLRGKFQKGCGNKKVDLFVVRFNSTDNRQTEPGDGVYLTDVIGMGHIDSAFSWLDRVSLSGRIEL